MKHDHKDILKKTDFFIDKIDEIEKVEEIADNKLKITTQKSIYVLGLYPIDSFKEIEKEHIVNNYLKNIGIDPLKIYSNGIMPDINKSYKVFEFRDEIGLREYLKESDSLKKFEIGKRFGSILKKIHSIPVSNIKPEHWFKNINTKLNFLLYKHGLQEYVEDRDYILIDFLKENLYLTKNTSTNLLYSNLNDKNIRVYDGEKLDIRGLKDLEYGDGISDFVEINKLAIENPEFARGVLESYYENKTIPRKFYRLLSFYQVFAVLNSLVNIRVNEKSDLSKEEIEKIFKMYDNFSNIKQSWIE